jgi:hypothetical protein
MAGSQVSVRRGGEEALLRDLAEDPFTGFGASAAKVQSDYPPLVSVNGGPQHP